MHANRLCCTLLVLLLSAGPAMAAEETHVFFSNGELNYFGPITTEANLQLATLHGKTGAEATVLAIRSGGGETTAGMELGAWVRMRKLDVKVLEACLSACANYVFPAARNKTVSNFAVIGYHGGLRSTHYDQDPALQKVLSGMPPKDAASYLADIRKQQAQEVVQETAFFRSIGVRPELTVLGQAEPYFSRYSVDDKMTGWTYSVEDFAKLGVDHITVINGPWVPRLISGKYTFFLVQVKD